jgi:hypothetical protein
MRIVGLSFDFAVGVNAAHALQFVTVSARVSVFSSENGVCRARNFMNLSNHLTFGAKIVNRGEVACQISRCAQIATFPAAAAYRISMLKR